MSSFNIFSAWAFILMFAGVATAQPVNEKKSQDPILFEIGNEDVTLSEFQYVFRKNNANAHFHEEDIRDYLDLYVKFKLKVKEADDLQLDTLPGVKNELGTYRSQLLNSYIDKEVSEALLKETYNRISEDVRISMIGVKLPQNPSPADTLKAYNKIMDIRKKLVKGENFEKVALANSEDPNVKINKGDQGFLTGMQVPYQIENAIFKTDINKVSMPVRSSWGYHLIKPTERRPAAGQIQVAHIWIKVDSNATKAQVEEQRKKADMIYKQLQNNEASFEELAAQYSDDMYNKDKGGVLPPFGTGKMELPFETAAFALENDNDISKPVRTNVGFHIIKRLSYMPIPKYEDVKEDLKKNLQTSDRYSAATAKLADQYKRQYAFIEYPQNKQEVRQLLDSTLFRGQWDVADKNEYDETLFMLENKKYTQEELIRFILDNQRKYRFGSLDEVFAAAYNQFMQEKVLDYGLSKNYPEYARLKQEYKDGIVMFELMEQRVWTKAIEDTAGLKAYYEQNKNKYMWGPRVDADIFVISDAKTAKKVMKKAKKMSNVELKEKYNEDMEKPVVQITSGKYEKGANATVDNIEWKEGWSEIKENDDGTVTVVRVTKVLEPMPKTLAEARGFFIADYQDYLEKQWVKELNERYPVVVHEEVLKELFDEH